MYRTFTTQTIPNELVRLFQAYTDLERAGDARATARGQDFKTACERTGADIVDAANVARKLAAGVEQQRALAWQHRAYNGLYPGEPGNPFRSY